MGTLTARGSIRFTSLPPLAGLVQDIQNLTLDERYFIRVIR